MGGGQPFGQRGPDGPAQLERLPGRLALEDCPLLLDELLQKENINIFLIHLNSNKLKFAQS